MRSKVIAGALIALGYLMVSQGASAFCLAPVAQNYNMALNISSLTVPRDAPNGTVLHRQEFHQAGEGGLITCRALDRNDAPPVTIYFNVIGLLANTGFTAAPFESQVYATSVPGIGVSWFNGWNYVGGTRINRPAGSNCPFVRNAGSGTQSDICQSQRLTLTNRTRVALIKTGPVGSGTVRAADLGRLQFSLSIPGENIPVMTEVGVTGAINVVSQTCTTPNVTVPMGTHRTSTFTGVGSASPQVPFNLNITNCPGFPGYYGGTTTAATPAASQSGPTNAGTRVPNTVSFRVDPVYTAIDAANGVFSLTPGTGVATGIGVQLLREGGAVQPLAQNRVLAISPTTSTTGFVISLAARYLQSTSTVTAGSANAVVNYTLIYQ
ncbi:hypothetical protein BFW87_25345 [Pseudomonas fluorescens]|uniref:Fimbrial-type adhesion domain-containing protein n=1 Tax=Pseudomonas fluorescens TaxID=294 RepID=A0A1T2Y1Y2_PSEFL|nr:fimbrial protein [Pseudomonas fluorescens]OPA86084.1 hypothetical protein BFW87_25345 [Pseudomonas fluorescens]